MKAIASQPIEARSFTTKVKHVLLNHLNAAYYCKLHIIEFLQQIESKTDLLELRRLISIYVASSRKQIEQLDKLYTHLKVQPSESMLTGIKSYTMEALIAIVTHSKNSFEKGLTILNYLQIVNAIDSEYVQVLNRMAKTISIPDKYLLTAMAPIHTNVATLERITEKYLTERHMAD